MRKSDDLTIDSNEAQYAVPQPVPRPDVEQPHNPSAAETSQQAEPAGPKLGLGPTITETKRQKNREEPSVVEVTIKIPLGPVPRKTHITRRIDARLKPADAVTYRRLFDALHNTDVRLSTGKHVDTQPLAIHWLLEQITASVTQLDGKKRSK